MDLATVATELYGLRPDEFTAARNQRVKVVRSDGDRVLAEQIRKLTKPSTAAWLVNMLARRHADELEQVLELGSALRDAADDMDPAQLRELNRQRHGLVAAVTRQGRALAKSLGHPVSEAVAAEVEQTLRAAMADSEAASAVRSGHLTAALFSAGLGTVDVSGSVAVPSDAGARPRPAARKAPPADPPQDPGERRRKRAAERQLTEARQSAQEAEEAAAQAQTLVEAVQGRLDAAGRRRDELSIELGELRQRIREVEREHRAAERAHEAADKDLDAAERAADTARRAADRARQRAKRLAQ